MTISHPVTQSGLLLVNKPLDMSSAFLVSRIKRITGAKKVGHAGTLDPFAGGLMICGINHGTRLSRFFLTGDKSYRAELTFGVETDTLDCKGAVVSTCSPDFFQTHDDFFSTSSLSALLKGFEGPQDQKPPVYSALKHQGVPLYKLARQGKPVQKEARPVVIYDIFLRDINPPVISFDVRCSSGTYIRSLAADIGNKAGCGAFLSALTRTESSGFTLSQALSLDEIASAESVPDRMISLNQALSHMPAIRADEALEGKIKNGVQLDLPLAPEDTFVKILDEAMNVIAILEFDKNKGRHNYCCVFHD